MAWSPVICSRNLGHYLWAATFLFWGWCGRASSQFHIKQLSQHPEIIIGCLITFLQKMARTLLPISLFFQMLGSNLPWGDDSEH